VSETNLRNLEQAQQDVQRLTEESHVLNQRVSTLQTELTASTNQIAKKDTTLANQHQQINELQAQLDNTQVQLKEKSQVLKSDLFNNQYSIRPIVLIPYVISCFY